MIAFLQPLPIGNAVRCLLAPAEGARATRVLRKVTDDIASETDPDAAVVYEGDERYFVDTQTLENGTLYHYKAFDHIGGSWVPSASAAVTPVATAAAAGVDPLSLVRERLHAGLKVEVAAGRLKHETGAVPVLTAPPAFENTKWPVVSLRLPSEGSQGARALGEMLTSDVFDVDEGDWSETEGWWSNTQLEVVGWSLNPDERHDLRRAIEKVVIGNLPVFASAGLVNIDFNQSTVDDMESYDAPVYSTVGAFSCLSPSAVEGVTAPITDVTVTASTPG